MLIQSPFELVVLDSLSIRIPRSVKGNPYCSPSDILYAQTQFLDFEVPRYEVNCGVPVTLELGARPSGLVLQ